MVSNLESDKVGFRVRNLARFRAKNFGRLALGPRISQSKVSGLVLARLGLGFPSRKVEFGV